MDLSAIQQNYSQLGPNFEHLGSSAGIYLRYNGNNDWSVVQLDCIQRFFRWLFGCHSSTHLSTIIKGLSEAESVPLALRNKVIASWATAYPAIECPLPAPVPALVALVQAPAQVPEPAQAPVPPLVLALAQAPVAVVQALAQAPMEALVQALVQAPAQVPVALVQAPAQAPEPAQSPVLPPYDAPPTYDPPPIPAPPLTPPPSYEHPSPEVANLYAALLGMQSGRNLIDVPYAIREEVRALFEKSGYCVSVSETGDGPQWDYECTGIYFNIT